EVARNLGFKRGMVLLDAFGLAPTRDDCRRGRMSQRELEGSRLDRDLVALGERLDLLDLGEDLGRCVGVFEMLTAGEDARAVGTANDDVDALRLGGWHQTLQRALMIQQGVATGQERAIRLDLGKAE